MGSLPISDFHGNILLNNNFSHSYVPITTKTQSGGRDVRNLHNELNHINKKFIGGGDDEDYNKYSVDGNDDSVNHGGFEEDIEKDINSIMENGFGSKSNPDLLGGVETNSLLGRIFYGSDQEKTEGGGMDLLEQISSLFYGKSDH